MKGTFHKSSTASALLKNVWWLLLGMLLVYCGAVCTINLSGVPDFYDADMYTDMCYAMEAWKHKSVFPEGWIFGNQLYVASTPVLATLFYGISDSPDIAMGLASSVMTLLVLMSFHWMMMPVVKSRQGRMSGSVLFMGMMLFFGDACYDVGGWQLMFTMCSYYSCYAVNVFLAFGCYLRSERMKVLWPILAMTCVLSFCTGIQSLRQTAVMTMPLLCIEFLRVLSCLVGRRTIGKMSILVTGSISAANITGLITARFLNLEQVEIFGDMNFTPLSAYFLELRTSILRALSLVLNYDPIGYMMLGCILLASGGGTIFLLRRCMHEKEKQGITLLLLMMFSVLAVLAVDVMFTMMVRPIYYFMLFPLLSFLCAICYENAKSMGKSAMVILLMVLFGLSCIKGLAPAAEQIFHKKEDSAYSVCEYLMENGYTTVYGAWNQGQDVVLASDWKLSAGFWESSEEPFFYYKYLCNPEIFFRDSSDCVYLFYRQEDAILAMEKAKTKGIEMVLVHHFPEYNIYVYTADENIMETFW